MRIIGEIRSIAGYVRIPVELTPHEATVISSVIGVDICKSRNRFIDMRMLELGLMPFNIYLSEKIESSGCVVVFNMAEEILNRIMRGPSIPQSERLTKLIEFFSFLSKYIEKIYEIINTAKTMKT